MKKIFVIMLLIVMMLSMTACGEALPHPLDDLFPYSAETTVENAVIPMNSVAQNISEAGVYAYASSLKTHYQYSSKEGDLGSYQFTLYTESSPMYFEAPWWVDGYNERITADIVIIAGQVGSIYTGTIECHKCDYYETIEEAICETTVSKTFTCNCDGNNATWGMEKNLTVTVIPLP